VMAEGEGKLGKAQQGHGSGVSGKPGAGWWNSAMFRYDILPDPPVAVSKGKKDRAGMALT